MTKNYYLLLLAYFASTVGDWFYQLALPLLVYGITRSATSMALTYGLAYLPYILFLPIGGVIADRMSRRRLLIGGDALSAVIVGLLAVVATLHLHDGWLIWFIYPAVFLVAGVTPFYHPAFQSIVPELVDDPHLPKANAWLQSAENLVVVIGPLVGGVCIAVLGATSALFVDATSFVASALLIAGIRPRAMTESERAIAVQSWLDQLGEGFRFVWSHPIIRFGSFLFLCTNFAITLIQANYIYFLTVFLHASPAQIGLAFALPGLGSIAGALITPKLNGRFSPGAIILSCTLLAGGVTLLLLAARDVLSIALPWTIVTGLSTVNAVTWFTLRQRVVPKPLLGRVVALTRLVAFTSIPIAAVVGGAIVGASGDMYLIIAIAAIVRLSAGAVGFLTPMFRKQASPAAVVERG